MRIKKFTGTTIQEATELMKTELGSNAIILNTRKIARGGKLQFLGKNGFEITAAIDDVPQNFKSNNVIKNPSQAFKSYLEQSNSPMLEDNPVESLRKVVERFEERNSNDSSVKRNNLHRDTEQYHQIKGELEDVKSSLKEITDHLKYERMPALPDTLKQPYMQLVSSGVEDKIAMNIMQSIYGKLTGEQLQNRTITERHFLSVLESLIQTTESVISKQESQRIIALVGPTGVGKTTTIAKLSAKDKLFRNLDVAVISIDTYRLGAIQQMQIFTDVAKIPMEIVYKPEEMTAVLQKFRNKQIIYIDTVGRSQRNQKDLDELQTFIDAACPHEVHLVINASIDAKSGLDILKKFGQLKPTRIIFSKVDETASLGNILNILNGQNIPVSYMTNGQTIPDDISSASAVKIATMIYSGERNG
jgi:flagellar biosynthesis protein FlhF